MNYTIYICGEAEIMTKYLARAEVIAEEWDPEDDVQIVDNATGKVVFEL